MFKAKVFCRYIHTDGLARVRYLLFSPKYTRVNGLLIKKCYNVICQKNKLPQSLWIISMSLKTIVKVFYLFALWRRDWLERYYAWKVLPKDTISVFSELWISSTHRLVWCIKCHVTWEHECGGPQISEVTRLGGVKNDPPLDAILQPLHPGVHFLKIIEWSLST